MLSCKEVMERSSDYLDGQLRLRERVGVRAHLAICVNCRRFMRQMRLSRVVLCRLPERPIPELDALAERLARYRRESWPRSSHYRSARFIKLSSNCGSARE